jgi:putative DNA primase/helicase
MSDPDYSDPRVLRFPGGKPAPDEQPVLEPDFEADEDDAPEPEVGLWPDKVDGEALFGVLESVFGRFLVLPDGAAILLALGVLHTYALYVAQQRFSPRFIITAPTRGCGKTLLMTVIERLVRRPFPTSGVTLASLRDAQSAKETALLDEMQQIPKKSKIW